MTWFFGIRKLNWMKAAPETKIFRNFEKYDPAKFSKDLRGVNWVDSMNRPFYRYGGHIE